MESFLAWLQDVFLTPSVSQTIIVISLVCGVGLLLGKLPMRKFSLGITWVFFVGIIAAHFGVIVEESMLVFAQNFGLVLFIYALGLQVGPSFFPSIKSGGIKENLISLIVILIGIALCVAFFYLFRIPMSVLVGIMSGATTNTPVLAAAQSTVAGINPEGSADIQSNMALACAVAYPMGVVGMILGMMALGTLPKKAYKKKEKHANAAVITEFEIANPAIIGKKVSQVAAEVERKFVVTRIWHEGKVELPTSETVFHEGDRLLITSPEEDIAALEILFGKKASTDWNREDIDWNAIDKDLISKRIVVTNKELNGAKLGAVRLRTLYGINVTRVDRSGIQLFASSDLHLQIGDRMTIVGSRSAIEAAEKAIGNEINMLDVPNLISLFLGLLLGCIVGMIPFYLPGISFPIKLGLAGGPIIIGILMGAFGPRLKLSTYITNSASLLIRQLGIVIYLGTLGLASGKNFFATIIGGQGWLWVLLGFAITLLPPVIVGWMSIRFWKMNYGSTCGMLCGSMANPMALDFLDGKIKDDSHNVSYATVYPLNMFLRIITAQMLILGFL